MKEKWNFEKEKIERKNRKTLTWNIYGTKNGIIYHYTVIQHI